MTESQILSRVEALRPNPYGSHLGDYLKSFDLRMRTELLYESMPVYDPEELALDNSNFEIYVLYLFSVIDFLNGEYGRYENSYAAFNKAYTRLVKDSVEKKSNPERSFKLWTK